MLEPQLDGFVVVFKHRGVQLVFVQLQVFGEKFPGELDGVFLEVIAKGKVAHHFKKGVVAGGAAHIFQVVVLAAHAQALLGRGGPFAVPLFLA